MVALRALGLLLALSAQNEPPAAGEFVLKNDVPAFEAKLPHGYAPSTDPRAGRSFERATGSADWERVVLRVYPGEGLLPEGESPSAEALAKPASIPSDARLQAVKESWGEFEVNAVDARFTHETTPFYARVVHLPLSPRHGVLAVFTPEPLEREARKDLQAALRTLTANTNWKSRSQKQLERDLLWGLRLTIGVGAAYPLAWLFFFRGNFMRAHLVRTLWLGAVGLSFLALVVVGGSLGYLLAALVFMSLAGRRLKLAIDEGD